MTGIKSFEVKNIYEQQKHNKRVTWLFMAFVVLVFTIVGLGFDYYYFGGWFNSPFGFPVASVIVLVFSVALAIGSLNDGAVAVLKSAQAVPADPSDLEQRKLINVVQEVSIAAGLPMPQVYIIPDDDPNAFATGKDPEHSYIAVTRGLLKMLDREELQGVIAHEMSHIRYYDIRFMTVVAAFAGAIVLLSDLALRGLRFGVGSDRKSNRSSRGGNPLAGLFLLIWLLTIILAPLISRLLAMAISRKREYLADAGGAELIRNPMALARALEKIENASEPTRSIKRGVAHLCIVDPTGRKLNNKEGFVAELFATHPPIQKRIMLLKAMAYQMS